MEEENKSEKKPLLTESRIEIIVAIFLGLTALLTAWASWIGSIHGGNQMTNYTKSTNLSSEGNAAYNAGMQLYLADLMAWNTVMDYSFDQKIAEAKGDKIEYDLITEKLENFIEQNCSEILVNAYEKMTDEMSSPFEVEGMMNEYFETADDLIEQSKETLEEGQSDNSRGDAFNLVNVIYSVVLFLLGIVGIFKKLSNRTAVLILSIIGFVFATVYMLTIPMPTGFDLSSFFAAK